MIERKGRLQRRCDATRDEALSREETRQESSLQPLVLEPTPSNAGVAAFADFQRLSSEPPTPALLDNAGVGTNPGTEENLPGGSDRRFPRPLQPARPSRVHMPNPQRRGNLGHRTPLRARVARDIWCGTRSPGRG